MNFLYREKHHKMYDYIYFYVKKLTKNWSCDQKTHQTDFNLNYVQFQPEKYSMLLQSRGEIRGKMITCVHFATENSGNTN